MGEIFDAAYPAGENRRAQSGFGGDEARWEAARRPIAEQIDRDGTFLDIGCADGYLMESVVRWATTRSSPTESTSLLPWSRSRASSDRDGRAASSSVMQ